MAIIKNYQPRYQDQPLYQGNFRGGLYQIRWEDIDTSKSIRDIYFQLRKRCLFADDALHIAKLIQGKAGSGLILKMFNKNMLKEHVKDSYICRMFKKTKKPQVESKTLTFKRFEKT